MILVGAGAIALGLVLWPKVARAAARQASGPLTGRGDGATVWSDAASAAYREQLARETAGAGWYGP